MTFQAARTDNNFPLLNVLGNQQLTLGSTAARHGCRRGIYPRARQSAKLFFGKARRLYEAVTHATASESVDLRHFSILQNI
ncbi:MAG: hypothetical protein JNJ94_10970 [Chlorobi bacterium]|nr:hypothetical protein [Chlorobiota bacterium]